MPNCQIICSSCINFDDQVRTPLLNVVIDRESVAVEARPSFLSAVVFLTASSSRTGVLRTGLRNLTVPSSVARQTPTEQSISVACTCTAVQTLISCARLGSLPLTLFARETQRTGTTVRIVATNRVEDAVRRKAKSSIPTLWSDR